MFAMLTPPSFKKSIFLCRCIDRPMGCSAFRLTSVITAAGYDKTTVQARHHAAALNAGMVVACMMFDEDQNETLSTLAFSRSFC